MHELKWVIIWSAALVLPLVAAIRGPAVRVNQLTINGFSYGGGAWEVSQPTLKASSGYLAYDPSGKSPKVTFRPEKGPGTLWTFVEVENFQRLELLGPARDGRPKDCVYEERTGYTMRIRVAEGPFEGWYLGCGDAPEKGPPELILVKKRYEAATLIMLQKTVRIVGHPK